MARSINKAILVGNLGADPEVRYTGSGTAVCTMSLATTDRYKDSSDEWVEKTEWHRVVAWARLAEICGEYLKKGSQVYFEGSIHTRQWEDQDGNTKYTTEVKAREMMMLGGRDSGGGGGFSGGQQGGYNQRQGGGGQKQASSQPRQQAQPQYQNQQADAYTPDDDLPF